MLFPCAFALIVTLLVLVVCLLLLLALTAVARRRQWGGWIAYEDPMLHTVFWYNSNTHESQWDKPAEVTKLQQAKLNEAKESWEARKKSSMKLKRIGDWIEYHGQGGKTFYYNESNGQFQWERPVELVRCAAVCTGGGSRIGA